MRLWFVLLLIAVLPFQLAWAAAAPYCQHEVQGGPHHLGHHEHEHKGASKHTKAKAADGHTVASGIDDDCGYCHLNAVQLVQIQLPATPPPASLVTQDPPPQPFQTRDPDCLERPSWRRA